MALGHHYYSNNEPFTEYAVDLTKDIHNLTRNDKTFTLSYDYQNNTNQMLYVVDRRGIRIALPPNPMRGDGKLVIRITIAVGGNVIINIEDLLVSSNAHDRKLAELIKETVDDTKAHRGHCHIVDVSIDPETIINKGGNVYFHNIDVVVSSLNEEYVAKHPATQAYHKKSLITKEPAVNDPSRFGYALHIVDSKGRFGKRFININNHVYSVPVKTDPTLPDGVYCVSSGSVEGNVDFAIPQTHCYSFDEADEKLMLYKTVEDARTYGDVFAQRDRELKELTMQAKEKEYRLKQEKQENDQLLEKEKLAIDKERSEEEQRRKEKQQEFEYEMKRRKDQQEREAEQFKFEMERRRSEEKQRQEYEKHKRERQAEEFKLEIERERNEEDRRRKHEIAEHEKRIEHLKEQYAELEHQRKVETLKHKEDYERRSYNRKESSEIVKFIPALITGIFAVAMAAMKIFS